MDLQRHEQELHRRGREEDEESYPCKLCGVHLENVAQIKVHLRSQEHRERAAKMARYLAEAQSDMW